VYLITINFNSMYMNYLCAQLRCIIER